MDGIDTNTQQSGSSQVESSLLLRLSIGIAQGIMLYLLIDASNSHAWPATNELIFTPAFLVACIVPLVLIAGCTILRPRRLIFWATLLAILLATLGFHDAWRAVESEYSAFGNSSHYPTALVGFFSSILVFIAFSLIAAGEAERRWIATYEAYFDTSWKLAVQLQFSGMFVGAFWILLWAGAALFQLIGLEFFRHLLEERWFSVPATTLAIAVAIHLTDVRPGIVRSIRTLLLTLLSWLLPLLVLIVGGFLFSTVFTGLTTLWATRHAAALLLGVSAAVVVLVNTTFQQGRSSSEVPFVLRHGARAACLFLLPMQGIAAYALCLRIDQYGLTNDRIIASACLLIASCYAIGYGWAALRRENWLGLVAPSNVLTSIVILAMLTALFTPVADPARLSVNSQLSKLLRGAVSPEKFDFAYLRFQTARYGRDALLALTKDTAGPRAADIGMLAANILKQKNQWENKPALVQNEVTRNLRLRTQGAKIPDDFLTLEWQAKVQPWSLPVCLTDLGNVCDTYVVDVTGDAKPEILLLPSAGQGVLFDRNELGQWQISAHLNAWTQCAQIRDALAENNYKLIAPRLMDLEINEMRFHLEPEPEQMQRCK